MKRFLFWLAGIFNVDLTVEKIIYRSKIVEVPKEVIVEKQIALEGVIDGDVTVNGDLFVTENIYVAGNIAAFGGVVYGFSDMEVKMKAGGGMIIRKYYKKLQEELEIIYLDNFY